jgi:glycosyltransferase involved in cell wall biosynthesis
MLLTLAVLTLAAVLATALDIVLGYGRLARLGRVAPIDADEAPSVAIIVAARDEARHLEHALESVLALDYPRSEVIVVDDRSTDETPAILARMVERNRVRGSGPALRVVRIDALPEGWLGKTHALHRGASSTTAELLLFTDADIVYEPTALARAARLMRDAKLDHLALGPDLVVPTIPLSLAIGYFQLGFVILFRPWAAPNPRSKAHIGIGAFNLVRADTYARAGGHAPIALRPDDDVKLGKLLKTHGARQALADAGGFVRVEWYRNFRELARGLRKNSFAGLEYSIARFIGAIAVTLLVNVWPFIAVMVTHGATRIVNALVALVLVALYAFTTTVHRNRPWLAPLYPIAALLFLWVLVDAVVRTLASGGIEWRGTRYDLDALRSNRV